VRDGLKSTPKSPGTSGGGGETRPSSKKKRMSYEEDVPTGEGGKEGPCHAQGKEKKQKEKKKEKAISVLVGREKEDLLSTSTPNT